MNCFKNKFLMLVSMVALSVGLVSCQDEGYEDVSGTASQTLWEVISTRSELSKFAQVLKQNGYDKVLSSSGTYTVFAPDNAQIAAFEGSDINEIPGAHISFLGYNKATLDSMTYISMINNRLTSLADLKLSDTEIVCRNGYLRFSGTSARATQKNIYELLETLSAENKMAAFITSLGDSVMDVERSVQVGIDLNTNQPIYDTVMAYYNPLFADVPLNDNDSLSVLMLVDNDTWDALRSRYSRYMRQHVSTDSYDNLPDVLKSKIAENEMEQLLDPTKDTKFGFFNKIDTVATEYKTCVELVRDLTCSYEGAVAKASANNPETVTSVYVSRTGIELTLDNATITDTLNASNGRIELANGLKIKLKNNKIKDVYIEAEDYYYTNESYVATLVDPRFSGSRYVKTYGIDSLRMYRRYVLDSLGQHAKCADGTDSTEVVSTQLRYVYNTSQYCNSFGGSVLGYKVNLYSCNYNIKWRHVVPGSQGSNYCNPDTLDVNYAKYAENPNWPIGGVMRHIQKMYLSQPGDYPLEYNGDLAKADFVKHPYPYDSYGDFGWYRCLTDYDPEATIASNATDEVGSKGPINWYRMGVNAGFALDDPTYETPLVWCQTAMDHANGVINEDPDGGTSTDTKYTSGIVGVSSYVDWVPKNNIGVLMGTVAPRRVPRDIFMCLYNGEATVFVTSNPFGTDNARGTSNLNYCKGSIFLDYIHFIPVIDEDD